MCISYTPPARPKLEEYFETSMPDEEWPPEAYQDYLAPIIRRGADGKREGLLANYAMVPQRHLPPGAKKFTTMNARAETIGTLRSYAKPWRSGQLCLVPAVGFYEPCYETGTAVRWDIGMRGKAPFAVAGLWRAWKEADGQVSHSFTQITVNADQHPLLSRFHKPGDEKRSLVVIAPDEYDAWLTCTDPELARSFLHLYPAEKMAAAPAPQPPRPKRAKQPPAPTSGELF